MGREQAIPRLIFWIVTVAALAWSGACSREHAITIGSKNFTEQVLVGEIIAQHVEHRLRTTVDRKLNLGGTLLAHQALVHGEIDLYPEYSGTALTSILKQPPAHDAATVLTSVRREYAERFHIAWLEPLGFNNTFAMVIRGEIARQSGIHSLSQAATYTPGWRLGVGYEFQQRADGLPGLLRTYPLPVRSVQTMDLGLLYQALGQKQVDMVAGNATDGLLSVMDVVVLEDDKHYFPPYDAAIAVRAEAFTKHPGLREALTELSGKFSDAQMRKLNYRVDGLHQPVREVAAEFLRQSGLLP